LGRASFVPAVVVAVVVAVVAAAAAAVVAVVTGVDLSHDPVRRKHLIKVATIRFHAEPGAINCKQLQQSAHSIADFNRYLRINQTDESICAARRSARRPQPHEIPIPIRKSNAN